MEGCVPVSFTLNGVAKTSNRASTTPLLWVLRDEFEHTGTKYGCGIVRCFACTVIINGNAQRTCNTSLSSASGKNIVTIEASDETPSSAFPLLGRIRKAWIQEQVPQCGYCQSGMIMAAYGLLIKTPNPTDTQIHTAMGNLCVCGTYERVKKAIKSVQTISYP